jgi:hypothetical protein
MCDNIYFDKMVKKCRIGKILIGAALVTFIINGCTYTKRLEPNLKSDNYENTKYVNAKLPYVLAIDGRKITDAQTTALHNAINMTVFYGDAMLESIKYRVANSFKNVYIVKTHNDLKEFDLLMSVSGSITSSCRGTGCVLVSNNFVNVLNDKNNILLAEKFVDNFSYNQPSSASMLGAIMGFTVFVTAPVLAPLATEYCGDELAQQISDSNDRVATQIAEAVIFSKALGLEKTGINVK